MDITLEQFAVATGATLGNAARYHEAALAAMKRFKISETAEAVAAFCGTVSIETGRLTKFEEDLYYRDAERLARLFRRTFDLDEDGVIEFEEIEAARRYCRMPKELSLKLYGGYHGRGAIQLTWEKNYRRHDALLGMGGLYLREPEKLLEPEHAFLTAGSYWDDNSINSVAHDMDEVTRRVNGPKRMHLAQRIAQRNLALGALV